MATTIRTPGVIDLTDQRIQVGDTVAFVEKINTTQQKLEQWTAQDWNNFASDVASVAGELETARDQSVTAKNQAVAAQGASEAARDQSVTAKNQAVAAQGASETARDQSVTAKDQALAAVAAITDQPGLIAATEAATGGRVTVRFTTKGQPCFFYKIPAFNCEDVAPDGSLGAGVHPAFIKNGVQESYILRAVYPAALVDGELVSQPGRDPMTGRTYDQELALAAATGPGFEIDDNMGWAATAHWCMANGFQPRGNTNYGRHHERRWETAQRSDGLPAGTTASGGRTITGTGPATWNHDGTPAGISDLVGNVWERCTGLKLIDGVFHVAPDGGTYAESEYVNTGVSAPADGVFSTRPTLGLGSVGVISGWSGVIRSVVAASDGSLIAVGDAGQYSRSTDNGVTWSAVSTISGWGGIIYSAIKLSNGTLLAVGDAGQYSRSTDNGVTWSVVVSISGFLGAIRSVVQLSDGAIVAVGYSARFSRSVDNGLSWAAAAGIYSGWSQDAMSVVQSHDGSLVVFGAGSLCSRSINGGVSWSAPVTISGAAIAQCVTRAGGGALVVVAGGGQYSRSVDNGVTWSAWATIAGWDSIIYFVLQASDGSLVAVGSSGQYSRSVDHGVTWSTPAAISGWTGNIWSITNLPAGGLLYAGNAAQRATDYTISLRRMLAIPAGPSMAPAGYFWRTTTGERVALRGTRWTGAGNSGLGALNLSPPRSDASSHIGCRLRFRDQ